MKLYIEIRERDTIPYNYVPTEGSTHYATFNTVGLHCPTPTSTPACKAWRQFVPFYVGFGMTQTGREPTICLMRGGHTKH